MAEKSVSAATLDEVETWENVTQARFVIKKFGAKGDLIDEMIGSRRKFHITTQERHINQEIAANDELDPFSNGSMAPVRLLDSTDDAEEIASNPNLMSETEMGTLLKGNFKTLEKRLGEVRNPALLSRLAELAVDNDCSIGKVNAINARLTDVAPTLSNEIVTTSDPASGPR